MMTAPTAAMATPPLSLLAFLGDVAIFTLVALATERAEAEFAIAGAAISDDAIRPAIRNFKRMSNIPFEKQVGRRYHCHCDHARKLSCERMGSSQKTRSMLRLRSEEHTSELQSLMRISYAVFCLKKKKKYNQMNEPNNAFNNVHYSDI